MANAKTYVDTLSKFGTRLEGEQERVKFTHLQTRYRARFFGMNCSKYSGPSLLPGSNEVTMDMVEFGAIKGAFKDETIENVNGSIYYPGKWTWEKVTFKVYNSYDNANYKQLLGQIQAQRDLSEQNTGTVSQNYKFVTCFEHTDGHQNGIAYWILEGCFLMSANPDSGGKNGDHAPTTITCDLRYDNASLYDYDGTLITGNGCTTSYLKNILAAI